MKIQCLGVCRFSILTEGGYRQGPRDMDERAAFLFQPRRLASRLAWFEHVLVPSIRRQDSDRFRFVVLTSDRIPQAAADRLRDIAAGIPTMEVELAPPGPHWKVANGAIRRRIDPAADVIAQFRLDDDDGLASNYVSRIHTDLTYGMTELLDRFGKVSCDYVRGLVLDADGSSARLRETYARTWPCAQTVYQRPGGRQLLFTWGHHRHHRDMPVVMLQDEVMFLRGRHWNNDSGLVLTEQDTQEADLALLPQLFGVSLPDLQSALRAAEALPEGPAAA